MQLLHHTKYIIPKTLIALQIPLVTFQKGTLHYHPIKTDFLLFLFFIHLQIMCVHILTILIRFCNIYFFKQGKNILQPELTLSCQKIFNYKIF